MTPIREIGLAGWRNGQLLPENELRKIEALLRRFVMRTDNAPYLISQGIHDLYDDIRAGRVLVHCTNGHIDGFCVMRVVDVECRRATWNCKDLYRFNEIRLMVVLKDQRGQGIATRLGLEAQLLGCLRSPETPGPAGYLRAVASVAAINADNKPAIALVNEVGGVVVDPEAPEVHNTPGMGHYVALCHDRVERENRHFPFLVAILWQPNMFDAAKLHFLGRHALSTTENYHQETVHYKTLQGDHTKVYSRAIEEIVDFDLNRGQGSFLNRFQNAGGSSRWVDRLGIADSIHTRGQGNVFCGNVTAEMKRSIAC